MSLTLLLTLSAVLYIASVAAGAALSLHTARSWHSAYWCQRKLSRFAAWHPVASSELYPDGSPRQAPTSRQLKELLLFAVVPAANTVVVLYVMAYCPLGAALAYLRDQLSEQGKAA